LIAVNENGDRRRFHRLIALGVQPGEVHLSERASMAMAYAGSLGHLPLSGGSANRYQISPPPSEPESNDFLESPDTEAGGAHSLKLIPVKS